MLTASYHGFGRLVEKLWEKIIFYFFFQNPHVLLTFITECF